MERVWHLLLGFHSTLTHNSFDQNEFLPSKILFTESLMSEVPSVFSCFRVFVISSHFFVTLQNFIANAPTEGLDKTCTAGFF